MPAPDDSAHGRLDGPPALVRRSGPDVRPLGALALATAVLGALLAVSYLLSPLAYLAAALAVPLGVAARGDGRTRATGTAALIIAVAATIGATVVLARS